VFDEFGRNTHVVPLDILGHLSIPNPCAISEKDEGNRVAGRINFVRRHYARRKDYRATKHVCDEILLFETSVQDWR
jgi:hypothetical protein